MTMGFVVDLGETFKTMNAMKFGSAIHGQKHVLGEALGSVITGGRCHFPATCGASWRELGPGAQLAGGPSTLPPRATMSPQGHTSPGRCHQDRGCGLRGPKSPLCLPDSQPLPSVPPSNPTYACFSAPQGAHHLLQTQLCPFGIISRGT